MNGALTLNGALNGPMNGGLNGPVNNALNGPMNGALNGPMNGALNGPMNGGLSGPNTFNALVNSPGGFSFASRLMEEEGIFYYSSHGGGHHTLGVGGSASALATPSSAFGLIHTGAGLLGSGGHTLGAAGGYGHVGATLYIDDAVNGSEGKAKVPAFEIDDFSFAVENSSTIGRATSGAGGGKAEFHEFTITKKADQYSVALFNACCAGSHYKTVTIEMRKAGGGDKPANVYLMYKFSTVFVTNVSWGGPHDVIPSEYVTFQFAKVEMEYTPQKSAGSSFNQVPHLKSSAVSIPRCPTCPY
jgi:type VI secretion system Hcp family effector